MNRGRLLFLVTYKAQYLQHIALDIREDLYNPRYGWVYADEDFMGRMAKIAKVCLTVRGPLRYAETFMFRYRSTVLSRRHRRTLARS